MFEKYVLIKLFFAAQTFSFRWSCYTRTNI